MYVLYRLIQLLSNTLQQSIIIIIIIIIFICSDKNNMHHDSLLSRVSTRDIDIAIMSVRPSICPSHASIR